MLGSGFAPGYGWIASEWRKNPLLLGYSRDHTESVSNNNAASGFNALGGIMVPAGEIWLAQIASARDQNSAPGTIIIYAVVNGFFIVLEQNIGLGASIWATWVGAVVLSEGDRIETHFSACTLNDDIVMSYHCVRTDTDQ